MSLLWLLKSSQIYWGVCRKWIIQGSSSLRHFLTTSKLGWSGILTLLMYADEASSKRKPQLRTTDHAKATRDTGKYWQELKAALQTATTYWFWAGNKGICHIGILFPYSLPSSSKSTNQCLRFADIPFRGMPACHEPGLTLFVPRSDAERKRVQVVRLLE